MSVLLFADFQTAPDTLDGTRNYMQGFLEVILTLSHTGEKVSLSCDKERARLIPHTSFPLGMYETLPNKFSSLGCEWYPDA